MSDAEIFQAQAAAGLTPEKCQNCGRFFSIDGYYYDFKTRSGPWMYGCGRCFFYMGGMLGTGMGQKFDLSGKKIAG